MLHLRRASAGLVALATLFVSAAPLPSLAATPSRQDTLNQALVTAAGQGSVSANGELKVTFQLKGTRTSDASGAVTLTFGVTNRLQSQKKGTRSDIRLALKNAAYKTALAGLPVSGTVSGDGATIESRVVDDLLYIRVNNMPESMQQGVSSVGLDMSKLQGRWVVFPVGILQYANQLPLLAPISQAVSSAQQNVVGKSAFAIKKIEKTWISKDGHNMFRARLGVNAALKKSLSKMDVVVEVDGTSGILTRLELGGTSSQTLKSCSTNTAGKQACRSSGTLNVRWNGGFSLQPDNGLAIAAPSMDGIVGIAGN